MKKPLLILLSFVCFISCKEQSSEIQSNTTEEKVISEKPKIDKEFGWFGVEGDIELIASWSASSPESNASGKVNSEDEVSIIVHQNQIGISLIHNNKATKLESIYDENLPDSTFEVEVYAYDFDKDGQKEIVVIYAPESSFSYVKVFKYLKSFSELVGNFEGQSTIIIEDNTIVLPYGGQGLYSEYLYKDNNFFELKYHSPSNKNN